MFKIGEFSQFSRVSVKMLRNYDELGLLKPASVDPYTNYRYYAASQLARLNRILALRDLGFSLEQIKTMLDDELTADQMRGMLKLRRAEIRQRLVEEEARLNQVEARLTQMEQMEQWKDTLPAVLLRNVTPQMVASIRQQIDEDSPTIKDLFERLEAAVARYDARAPQPPLLIYHDTEYQETAQDIEVAVPIKSPVPTDRYFTTRELAGYETVACLIHTGSYKTLPQAFATLLTWIETHGYKIIGPLREAYLRFGADLDGYDLPETFLTNKPAEFVTELQIPTSKI